MNSRAAYDEDEVLRKVLEESKSEGGAGTTDNGTRKKRSRDDSEEWVHYYLLLEIRLAILAEWCKDLYWYWLL